MRRGDLAGDTKSKFRSFLGALPSLGSRGVVGHRHTPTVKDRVEGRGSRRGSRRPSGSHPASGERVHAPLWRQRAGEGCAAPLLSDFWDLGPRFPHLSLFSFSATNRPGSAGGCRWRWGQSRFDRDRLNRWDRSSLRPPRASRLKQKPSRRSVCSAPTSIVVVKNHGCTNGRRSDRALTSDRLRYQSCPASKTFCAVEPNNWLVWMTRQADFGRQRTWRSERIFTTRRFAWFPRPWASPSDGCSRWRTCWTATRAGDNMWEKGHN